MQSAIPAAIDQIPEPFIYVDGWVAPAAPPSAAALDSIAEGGTVKISNGRERFFVTIVALEPPLIVGRVDNVLVRPAEYAFGDLVAFTAADVWHVRSAAEREDLARALSLLMSAQIASGVPAAEVVRRFMHSTALGEQQTTIKK